MAQDAIKTTKDYESEHPNIFYGNNSLVNKLVTNGWQNAQFYNNMRDSDKKVAQVYD